MIKSFVLRRAKNAHSQNVDKSLSESYIFFYYIIAFEAIKERKKSFNEEGPEVDNNFFVSHNISPMGSLVLFFMIKVEMSSQQGKRK
jgi:hypothetical protein